MYHRKLKEAKQFIANDETRLREILHPTNDNLSVGYSVAHAVVAAGKASLPHTLKSSETYYILEGKGRMHINGEIKDVARDDIFLVPPLAEQYIENISSEDLIFLCIVEPFWQEEEEEIF